MTEGLRTWRSQISLFVFAKGHYRFFLHWVFMNRSDPFFQRVLGCLVSEGAVHPEDSVLVVCGGDTDHANLREAGFTNVTISNLDERMQADGGNRYAPYGWRYEHAEALGMESCSYDVVMVHSGLHHLRCPLKGVTEMYRVARKGILGFEPNLNAFTRLGARLGFGQRYETAAVYFNDCRWGGVENSEIPNHVFRFRRDDIHRTVQTFNPVAEHECRIWYATRFPSCLSSVGNPFIRIPAKMGAPLFEMAGRICPFLANNMAFWVRKPRIPEELFPWLRETDGGIHVNKEYLEGLYDSSQGSNG